MVSTLISVFEVRYVTESLVKNDFYTNSSILRKLYGRVFDLEWCLQYFEHLKQYL